MTTFKRFALKTEASRAKKVFKHIFKTWNASDVVVYVWFIYSWIKKLKYAM